MLGIFNKKKERLSRTDFVALMLSFQQRIVSLLLKSAQQWNEGSQTLSFQPKPYECEILSLCIISLAIPDDGLKDTIHNEYCRHMNLDNDAIKQFYARLNMRYKQYYEAFNDYLKNPTGGPILGSVVANGLKGGEYDKIELDAVKIYAAFNLFAESFKSAVGFIESMKGKYDLSEVSSSFVAK